jgi:uncharacterized protein with HEPN domain
MQPHNEKLKYLLDIQSIILELDKILTFLENDYTNFSTNFIAIRAVERELMIIGEAINKLKKIEPDLSISNSNQIIGLRNMIVHAYDAIDPTLLWKILIKDLPVLKIEIQTMISQ